MLNKTTSTTVKPAWPAAKETAAGATPASRIEKGSSTHKRTVLVPIRARAAAPMTKPATVPASPRRTFWPVLRAFERSTDKVPSTTQNECCTPVRSATRTARPRATAPRTALCKVTECRSKCETARLLGGAQAPARPGRLASRQSFEEAAPFRGGRQVDVGGNLGDSEAELLGPEARVQGGDELGDLLLGHEGLLARQRPADRQLHGGGELQVGEAGSQLRHGLAQLARFAFS